MEGYSLLQQITGPRKNGDLTWGSGTPPPPPVENGFDAYLGSRVRFWQQFSRDIILSLTTHAHTRPAYALL